MSYFYPCTSYLICSVCSCYVGLYTIASLFILYSSAWTTGICCAAPSRDWEMAHIQLVKQTSSGLLLPATPESCDFLHQIKIGEWIHADFKRVRNYAFHKRFFKLLQLGFDYWTPVGGAITSRERKLVSGFVDYLCDWSAGNIRQPWVMPQNNIWIPLRYAEPVIRHC